MSLSLSLAQKVLACSEGWLEMDINVSGGGKLQGMERDGKSMWEWWPVLFSDLHPPVEISNSSSMFLQECCNKNYTSGTSEIAIQG